MQFPRKHSYLSSSEEWRTFVKGVYSSHIQMNCKCAINVHIPEMNVLQGRFLDLLFAGFLIE